MSGEEVFFLFELLWMGWVVLKLWAIKPRDERLLNWLRVEMVRECRRIKPLNLKRSCIKPKHQRISFFSVFGLFDPEQERL